MKVAPAALLLLSLLMSCHQAPGPPSSPVARVEAVYSLFNGRDLDGWEHVGPGKFVFENFVGENGALRTEGGMGLLWYTREQFGNCKIRVVYKTTSAAANSGVFVRIADLPKDEWFAV